MQVEDLKVGTKFTTNVDDKIRNFQITKITASRITVVNLAGYSHLINKNRMTCHAFSYKQVADTLAKGYWKFN